MKKYEIEPLNNFSDEEILADIRRVCKSIGKSTILQSDYLRNGKFGSKAIRNHFGNFHGALRKLGLEIKRTGYYSDAEIVEDVLAVKRSLGVDLLTGEAYYHNGKFKKKAIDKHFGSWGRLMDKLGLEKNTVHVKHSPQELFGIMKSIWDEKGCRPSMSEFLHRSGHTKKYILARFKSWTEFLRQFSEYANNGGGAIVPAITAKKTIGSRCVPPKLRYKVMKRDNWTCVLCGVRRTRENNVQLHVDHITPYSKGGKTVLSNLRTLCSTCNLGRGNGD